MKILTKTALNKEHIIDRINKGASDFEIHTTTADIYDIYNEINSKLELIKSLDMNIYVVHSPIGNGFRVEDLLSNFKKIKDFFFLANEIGKLQNRVILAVMHINIDLSMFDKLLITNKIIDKLKYLNDEYEYTSIVVENVMSVSYDKEGLVFRTTGRNEAAEFVEYFNKTTNSNVGTVFDTCHALSTIKLLEKYRGYVDDKFIPNMDDYINRFINTLKVVNLSYSKNLGVGKDHGILYEKEEEVEVLEKIIKSLYNVGYNGFITLEVSEENHSDTKNWVITRKNLNKVLDRLNIKNL